VSCYQSLAKEVLGQKVSKMTRLQGGCIGDIYKAILEDGQTIVVKTGGKSLEVEARMLRYLKEHSQLPVPEVLAVSPEALLMSFVPGSSQFDARAQEDVARHLAGLHSIRGEHYGLNFDTVIGGLPQPNTETSCWLDFYRDQRILAMADLADLPPELYARLRRFCDRLDEWLIEPELPALLHGDCWTTNMLAEDGKITGFLDPAIYYGHPEIELAFTTLFGTFGEPFFKGYQEISPIADGFFEVRRELYFLYPLLVHVRLFGMGYAVDIDRILRQIGI